MNDLDHVSFAFSKVIKISWVFLLVYDFLHLLLIWYITQTSPFVKTISPPGKIYQLVMSLTSPSSFTLMFSEKSTLIPTGWNPSKPIKKFICQEFCSGHTQDSLSKMQVTLTRWKKALIERYGWWLKGNQIIIHLQWSCCWGNMSIVRSGQSCCPRWHRLSWRSCRNSSGH